MYSEIFGLFSSKEQRHLMTNSTLPIVPSIHEAPGRTNVLRSSWMIGRLNIYKEDERWCQPRKSYQTVHQLFSVTVAIFAGFRLMFSNLLILKALALQRLKELFCFCQLPCTQVLNFPPVRQFYTSKEALFPGIGDIEDMYLGPFLSPWRCPQWPTSYSQLLITPFSNGLISGLSHWSNLSHDPISNTWAFGEHFISKPWHSFWK